MPEETKVYPVVDANGAPLYAANGDPITSTDTPDSSTTDGRPAVSATASNAPHDATPKPASSEGAPPAATDPGYQAAATPAPSDSGSTSSDAPPPGDPAPASAPTSSQSAPVTQDGSAAPAATAAAPASDPNSDAPPASQGSGTGAVPPGSGNPAAVPPAPVPGSPTVTQADLAASDPSTPPQATPSGTTPVPPAQATDDPNTPPSVATDKGEGQAPSTETLNPALTTTVDATTIAKAKAEQDAETTGANTPAKVLGDAVAAATPAATDPEAPPPQPLVVAPGTADGLRASADNGGVTQEGTKDIGHGAADASVHDVVETPPAQGNGISDGRNAGATSPTGYVAPVRVSAAGVPADDPTLAALASGDMAVTDLSAHAPPPGTSDRPNPAAPSLGPDASAEGTAARTGGSAQASPYVGSGAPPGDTNANAAAQAHAQAEASTGAPRPASTGDTTLASPVAAGDVDAANKAAADAGKDAPQGATLKNPDGSFPSLKPQTPEDAAKVLTDADALPAPVAADVKASTAGPQAVSELDASKGEKYTVTHVVETKTEYAVYANSSDEAVAAVKRGDGVKVRARAHDDWDAETVD